MKRAVLTACQVLAAVGLVLAAWRVGLAAVVGLRSPLPAVASDRAWDTLLTAGPFLLVSSVAGLVAEALVPVAEAPSAEAPSDETSSDDA